MNEKNKIDDLFRNALFDYKEESPSNNNEDKVFWLLNYTNYTRIFKITLGIIIIAIPVTLFAYLLINNSNLKHINSITESNKVNQPKNASAINLTERNSNNTSQIKNNDNQIVKNKIHKLKKENNIAQLQPSNLEISNATISNTEATNSAYTEVSSVNEESAASNNALVLKYTESNISKIESLNAKEIEISKNEALKSGILTLLPAENYNVEANTEENIAKLKPIEFTKSYNSISIELSGNLFNTDKKLSSTNEFASVVKFREINESKILTYAPGIELKFNTKNLFFQTGLNYQIYGEKVNYNFNVIENIINNKLTYYDSLVYVRDSAGHPGYWRYDTIWYNVKDTSYLTQKRIANYTNTFRYIEIPLLIGKSFAVNKFIVDISTGFSFGFLIKADAFLLATDNKTIDRIENRNSPYLNDLQLNYILRIALRYQLNEKWSFFVRPSMKMNMGSLLNQNQYPIQQKYTLYGIGMGMMYTF
ncbi:MAG: hypothetical protein NTZ33_16100 [Bacteroidetes bacterium]|nr:hypothetical protein [Bacteroidota bacterium]